MRIATSTNLFETVLRGSGAPHYTCEESLAGIAAAGFEAADVCFYSCCVPGHPFADAARWESWAAGLGEAAQRLGLVLSQAHAVIFGPEDAAARAQNEEWMRRCIAAAGRLGIPWLVVHPFTVRDEVWYSHKQSLAATREAFLRWGEEAARCGVGLCAENLPESRRGGRTFGASCEDLLELAGAVGDERFGICWDTGHAHLNGADQPAAIRQLGGWLKALHINDNLADRDAHLAPYMGSIAWEPLVRALHQAGYGGDFTYEVQGYTNALPPELHPPAAEGLAALARHMLRAAGTPPG